MIPCRKGHLGRPSKTLVSDPPRRRLRRDESRGFRHGPEPLHSDHDLSTPGYGVEFTWRTDMVWMKVRGVFFVFFGSAVDEVGAHEIFYGRTASSKRARGSK